MILAAAQIQSFRENTKANIAEHIRLTQLAAQNGANLIIFPEMSLTGYERELAASLAFEINDNRLKDLISLSIKHQIIIVAGAPIQFNQKLHIGSFIILPDGEVNIYIKQFLHDGEDAFFASSLTHNPLLKIGEEKAAFAICADIDHYQHASNAGKAGASLYLASIFFSPNGIPEAHQMLSSYAREFEMNVLMSNYKGRCWEMEAGGQSGFWDQEGNLIVGMEADDSGLIIVKKRNNSWAGKVIKGA